MTYDLRGASDEMASHHSALYSGSYEEGEQKVFNQVWKILILDLELIRIVIKYRSNFLI